ncbi:MAG: alpha/beta fold hydrolase [Lachnospiraceae bacterium]|nr:alpha/beta fold hydrolase [Lachnospiraceae bacterium]
MTGFLITTAIIFIAVIASVLVLSYVGYSITFKALPRKDDDTPILPKGGQYDKYHDIIERCVNEMYAREYEAVTITSFDGLKLYARYYHVADNAPLHIQMHGYKSSAFVDFSGGNKLAAKMGHNTLVVDERSHGRSEGKTITFGVCERKDCLKWIEYAINRFGKDTKIILDGLSMGAATVLMAADQNLPESVVGIMADCPYSSPKEIIQKVGKEIHYPPKLMYPFVKLGARIYGHFDLEESSAVEAVKEAKLPILLVHGLADDFVPCGMSRLIKAAGGDNVELHTFEHAGHGLCYMVDPEHYEKVVTEFLERILK